MTWKPGCDSPNPAGRPRGTADKRTRYRQLLEPHAEEIVKTLIEQAIKGCPVALRLCIERLIPKTKSEPIDLVLPNEFSMESVIKLGDQILREIGLKNITPAEGKDMFDIIKTHTELCESLNLLERINLINEQFIKLKNKLESDNYSGVIKG